MADPDIVTRLRAVRHNDRSVELMSREAADEIERLRAERDAAYAAYSTAETTALELFAQRVAIRKAIESLPACNLPAAIDVAIYKGSG
jgi:hypothetical protein